MTEITFKGKEFVYNHHLAVPFRPLVPDESKGIGPVALDGNLVIHGDNLHALKALLPLYTGKVESGDLTRHEADDYFRAFVQSMSNSCI